MPVVPVVCFVWHEKFIEIASQIDKKPDIEFLLDCVSDSCLICFDFGRQLAGCFFREPVPLFTKELNIYGITKDGVYIEVPILMKT